SAVLPRSQHAARHDRDQPLPEGGRGRRAVLRGCLRAHRSARRTSGSLAVQSRNPFRSGRHPAGASVPPSMSYSSGFSNPFGFVVTPWVKKLLIANAGVFLFTLAFGAVIRYLQFTPSEVYLRPWSVVTYMFVHLGVFHLLFNML